MVRRTGIFKALGSDSETYTLVEFTDFINAGTLTDPHAEMTNTKELKTSDGLTVIRLGKGKYKVLRTGVMLHSDSPDAP